MAPTTRSSVHSRITQAPKQIKMPYARKLIRPRFSPPALLKRQSTLTQLDYVQTPHSSARRREVIEITSDEDESDYEEAQPRSKKRKRNTTESDKATKKQKQQKGKNAIRKKNPNRSTLTQMWSSSSSLLEIKDSDESEEELDIPDEDVSGFQEHFSESDLSAAPRFGVSSDVDRQSTRPTTADSNHPNTPKKVTKTVIPSSNTPASLVLSIRSVKSRVGNDRSPLKERSVNISPAKHLELSRRKIEDAEDNEDAEYGKDESEPAAGTWIATLAITPKKDRQQQPRKLVRTTTVQDSEDDEMDFDFPSPEAAYAITKRTLERMSDVPSPEAAYTITKRTLARMSDLVEHSDAVVGSRRSASPILRQQQSQTPIWKRTGVVQDSEDTSLDMSDYSPTAKDSEDVDMSGIAAPSPVLSGKEYMVPEDDFESTIQHEPKEEVYQPAHEDEASDTVSEQPVAQVGAVPQHASESAFVQDSEDEEETEDLNTTLMAYHTPAIDARKSQSQPQSPSVPMEKQIIEIDDEEEEEVAEDEDYCTADEEHDGDEYQQHTYDPVQAALERDAARFGKTNTQLNAEQLFTQFLPFGRQMEEDEEDEEDEENEDVQEELRGDLRRDDNQNDEEANDADVQEEMSRTNEAEENIEFVPSSQPNERTTKAKGKMPATDDLDDSGYGTQHSLSQEKVPSSQPLELNDPSPDDLPEFILPTLAAQRSIFFPATQSRPALRPSQISTVVDSQSSPNNSRRNSAHAPLTFDSIPPASSSPFPIPPDFSQMKDRYIDDSQLSLKDFSLPRPPPLSSSQVGRED